MLNGLNLKWNLNWRKTVGNSKITKKWKFNNWILYMVSTKDFYCHFCSPLIPFLFLVILHLTVWSLGAGSEIGSLCVKSTSSSFPKLNQYFFRDNVSLLCQRCFYLIELCHFPAEAASQLYIFQTFQDGFRWMDFSEINMKLKSKQL